MDIGYRNSSKELERLEQRIQKEYNQALTELKVKADDYFSKFQEQDKKMLARMNNNDITHKDYIEWRKQKILVNERYKAMVNGLAKDLTNTDVIAARMIDKTLPYAYAENYNYAGYEICHGLNMNISFDLVDHETVERLLRDNPKLLPKPRVKIPEDQKWNEQKLNSALTQGILQGDSIPNIAKRLKSVTDMDSRAAIRNARTMTTGAESAGRLNRYKQAEQMGINLNKVWMATHDGRTRDWHIELDGASIPLNEMFVNEYGEIECPGDTGADPANVYNCRCRMISEIHGYNLDFSGRIMDDDINGMTYEEWKDQAEKRRDKRDEKRKEQGKIVYEKQNYRNYQAASLSSNKIQPAKVTKKTEKSWDQKITDLRKTVEKTNNGVPTTDQVMKAGSILSQEMDRALNIRYAEYQKAVDAYEKAGGIEYAKLQEELSLMVNSDAYAEGQAVVRGLLESDETKLYKGMSRDEVFEYMRNHFYGRKNEINTRMLEISSDQTFNDAMKARSAAKKAINGTYQENTKLLFDKLSKVREMGSNGIDVTSHLMSSRSPMRKVVEEAYGLYPRSWVEKSAKFGVLKPMKTSRGYYSHWSREIAISGYSKESQLSTAVHELGHRFERTVDGMRDKEKAFYEKRTAGQPLEWLGVGYRPDEKSRKDDFLSAYMGKDYGGSAYELVSMGFQYAYTDPVRLAKDKDMRDWIHGLLCLMP